MTVSSMLSLFLALVVLAVIPGPGVFTVVARSMASGFNRGLVTVFGIIFGDYILLSYRYMVCLRSQTLWVASLYL